MHSLPTQQPILAATILDIALDNWSIFQPNCKLLCFTKFGVAGQQILSNRAIPLTPFATAPSKFDLDRTDAGAPIIDQFTYARQPTTATEVGLPGFSLASISLTESGNRELRDDLKIYNATLRIFNDEDTLCLDYLYRHISPKSLTSIKTHPLYLQYEALPIGKRSFVFYGMAKDIHSIGNATTKLHRTRLYMNITQGSSAHEVYMDQVTTMAETFALDFGSTEHPGYVRLSEITSFLYLAGLNRTEFRRAIDDLLQNNPSGRFPDPSILMTQLQAWKIANSLSFASDKTSTQGSALVAAKTPSTPKTKSTTKDKATTKIPHLFPNPCTWCLAADKVSRFGHLSSHCSKNPHRILTPASTPATPSSRIPSNMSNRLHALLSQLDESDTPQSTNATMLFIAEAAIGASDFPDSA